MSGKQQQAPFLKLAKMFLFFFYQRLCGEHNMKTFHITVIDIQCKAQSREHPKVYFGKMIFHIYHMSIFYIKRAFP